MDPNQKDRHTGLLPEEEHQCLKAAAAGDLAAYEQLYQYYLPRLYHYIYRFSGHSREDAEEICQEVFIRLWEKRESLAEVRSLEGYLKRAGRNALLDLLKHRRFKAALHDNYSRQKATAYFPTADAMEFAEYNQHAMAAIRSLPANRRRIFELRTQENLSVKAIAAHMGISRSRVKQQFYIAREHVRNYLRRHGGWTGPLLILLFFFISGKK